MSAIDLVSNIFRFQRHFSEKTKLRSTWNFQIFFQENVADQHKKLAEEIAPKLNNATSEGGAKVLQDDLDDINSRMSCETIILDRKIQSLTNLRDKWKDTEVNLKQLSSDLKKYEIQISDLEKDVDLEQNPKDWFGAISNIEKDSLIPLEKQIVKCEIDILELEQHVEGATRLTARVANLRGRYDMLRQNTKAMMAKGTESITAGQRAQITLNGVEETLDRVNNLIAEIKETKIGNVSMV